MSPSRRKMTPLAPRTARRPSDQRVEHGLQIERRAADDLQHVGGRGLLLQRLGEIARARLHLVEQPHVLDRDHGLVGEGLRAARSGVAVNGPGSPARHDERADRFAVAQQRHDRAWCERRRRCELARSVIGVARARRECARRRRRERATPDDAPRPGRNGSTSHARPARVRTIG